MRSALLCLVALLVTSTAQARALTVDDCVRLALDRAPAAQAATFDAAAAAARVRAARVAYVPRLLAQGEYGRSQGFDETVTNGGSTAALLTFEATLLDGGLRDAQLDVARARLQSATAIVRQRRADIALAVRTAYFSTVAARAETAIQSDNIHLLDDYTARLQHQERSGLVPRNDVLRAHLAAATARAAQRAADAQLTALGSELAILAGIDVPAVSLTEPEAISFAEPTDEMLDASPVMVDARSAVEAARRDADVVRSEGRGHVTLTASGGALGVQPGPTFRDNGGGQFLVGFSLPLYDGGAVAARIAAAAAAVNSAEATLRQTRQTVSIALSRVRAEARRAQADVASWRRVAPQAEENFQLMRARHFGGGNVRLLEVLDALSQYVDARLNVPRADLSLRMAAATQRQILGETMP